MTGEVKVDKNATFTDVVKTKVVFKIIYKVYRCLAKHSSKTTKSNMLP